MKLNTSSALDLESGGDKPLEASEFKVRANAHVFWMLIDMYKLPWEAVIREALANAADAMEPGDDPISVDLPNIFDPQFVLRDYARGMTREQVMDSLDVGSSTKQEDNTKIGGFGVGLKAPFTVTGNFTITSISKDGYKTIIACSGNRGQLPKREVLFHGPSNERSGTEIRFSVPRNEHETVKRAFLKVMRYLPIPVKSSIAYEKAKYSFQNEWGGLRAEHDYDGFKAIMAGIQYDLSGMHFPDNVHYLGIDLFIPNGSVQPVPSREALNLTEQAKTYLIGIYNKFIDDMLSKIVEAVSKETPGWNQVVTFRKMVRDMEKYGSAIFNRLVKLINTKTPFTGTLQIKVDGSYSLFTPRFDRRGKVSMDKFGGTGREVVINTDFEIWHVETMAQRRKLAAHLEEESDTKKKILVVVGDIDTFRKNLQMPDSYKLAGTYDNLPDNIKNPPKDATGRSRPKAPTPPFLDPDSGHEWPTGRIDPAKGGFYINMRFKTPAEFISRGHPLSTLIRDCIHDAQIVGLQSTFKNYPKSNPKWEDLIDYLRKTFKAHTVDQQVNIASFYDFAGTRGLAYVCMDKAVALLPRLKNTNSVLYKVLSEYKNWRPKESETNIFHTLRRVDSVARPGFVLPASDSRYDKLMDSAMKLCPIAAAAFGNTLSISGFNPKIFDLSVPA